MQKFKSKSTNCNEMYRGGVLYDDHISRIMNNEQIKGIYKITFPRLIIRRRTKTKVKTRITEKNLNFSKNIFAEFVSNVLFGSFVNIFVDFIVLNKIQIFISFKRVVSIHQITIYISNSDNFH